MSGGSLGYIGHKLGEGDITAAMAYWPRFIEFLERTIEALRTDQLYRGHLTEPKAHPEKVAGEIALAALLDNACRIEKDVQALTQRMAQLQEVGVTADRMGSGDDGPDQLVDEAIRWMRERLK